MTKSWQLVKEGLHRTWLVSTWLGEEFVCILRRSAVVAVGVFLIWLEAGCGPYSFSGSTTPHIKSVAVPIFEDETAEFRLKEQLTNSVIQAFTRDNTLKVVDRRAADALVQGTILRVAERAGIYTAEEQVQEIRVTITANIKYEDLKKRKIIWEERITQFGTYTPGSAASGDRQTALTEAIGKIATEVINKSVSSW
ncbi:MAG: LptE family protein [bacterium]